MLVDEPKYQFLRTAELIIVRGIRRTIDANSNDVRRPTGHMSETFKHYVSSLTRAGWIRKTEAGSYLLTAKGERLASDINTVDEKRRALKKQPELTMLLVVQKPGTTQYPEYLFQQRLSQPHYGFWGLVGGPVVWAQGIEDAAAIELRKQTGLSAKFHVQTFCRVLDRGDNGILLEDKLCAVMVADDVRGTLDGEWRGGKSKWLSVHEYMAKDGRFPLTKQVFDLLDSGSAYVTHEAQYATAV